MTVGNEGLGGYVATWVTSSEESQNYRISREQQDHVLEDGAALLDGPWYSEHTVGCKSYCVCREESCACSSWCEVCDGLPRIRMLWELQKLRSGTRMLSWP